MATASNSRPPSTTPEPAPEAPGDGARDAQAQTGIRWGHLHLLPADPETATATVRRWARRLQVHHTLETAYNLQASVDPAEALRGALRECLVYETKQLARVFCGRILKLQPRDNVPTSTTGGHGDPSAGGRLSSHLEVHLETAEDERVLHLEGAWAWNLHAAQAEPGDIIQIDRKSPLITVKNDPSLLDGRVLDERVHWIRLSLGSLDRVHQEHIDTGEKEEAGGASADIGDSVQSAGDDLMLKAAASLPTLFATGERVAGSPRSRAMTDRWLRRHLPDKKARLEAGVLLVTEASLIPISAMAALQAALRTANPPAVLLSEPEGGLWDALVRELPEPRRLSGTTA